MSGTGMRGVGGTSPTGAGASGTGGTGWTVRRWTRLSQLWSGGFGLLLVALALVPLALPAATVQQLTSLLVLVLLAVMWNTLAGYGGMVSIGQQAYLGLGAYGTVYLTQHGVSPYPSMLLAALAAGVVALPLSLLVLRLRGGRFAIGTWVVAETLALVVALDQSLGGGTGTSLRGLNVYAPQQRRELTYWLALGFTAALLGAVFALLRSRRGAALQAIRDDEEAAGSLGVPVRGNQRLLYVLAALGCGAAGSLTLANTLFVQPTSIFGVQWSAYMIFMVLVGGIGTFEGPIVGAVLFFLLQQHFADQGAWYLIGLGTTAVLFALLLPQGLWGLVEHHLGRPLLPLGQRLEQRQDDEQA